MFICGDRIYNDCVNKMHIVCNCGNNICRFCGNIKYSVCEDRICSVCGDNRFTACGERICIFCTFLGTLYIVI